jgi:hypothetical protein
LIKPIKSFINFTWITTERKAEVPFSARPERASGDSYDPGLLQEANSNLSGWSIRKKIPGHYIKSTFWDNIGKIFCKFVKPGATKNSSLDKFGTHCGDTLLISFQGCQRGILGRDWSADGCSIMNFHDLCHPWTGGCNPTYPSTGKSIFLGK